MSVKINRQYMIPYNYLWLEQEKLMKQENGVAVEAETEFVKHAPDAVAGSVWVEGECLFIVNTKRDILRTPIEWVDDYGNKKPLL